MATISRKASVISIESEREAMKNMRKISLFSLVAFLLLASISQASAYVIFVSNEKDDTVSVIDGASLKVIDTIQVGHRPRGIIISPDHKTIIVCLGDDGQIAMVDANTFKVERKIDSGSDPELLNISPDGKILYVANEDDSLVTIVDFKTGNTIQEIPIGVEPEGMAVNPERGSGGRDVGINQHGAFHRRQDLQGSRQCPRQFASSLRRIHQGWLEGLGFLRSRRQRFRHRYQDLQNSAISSTSQFRAFGLN